MALHPTRLSSDNKDTDIEGGERAKVRGEGILLRLAEAEADAKTMPESELHALRVGNLELELEIFRNEHDNTGSYKFKRFGKEIGQMFDAEEGGPLPRLETGPDGLFENDSATEKRRMIFVDMLELDRLNKEGGSHDVGDQGLNRAADVVREIAEKYGSFDIFRSGGNQFMLDMIHLDDEAHDRLVEELSSVSVVAKEGIDPAPLIANSVDFKDAVADLNLLQMELGSSQALEPHEASRELVGLIVRSGEWGSEIKKFVKRAGRVREMLEREPDKAKDFFNNYVRRSFENTPYGTWDDFRKLVLGGNFDDVIRNLAFQKATARFEFERDESGLNEEESHRIARSKLIWERAVAHKTGKRDGEQAEGIAEIPEQTRGEASLSAKATALETARATYGAEPTDINEAMVERRHREMELDEARRDHGTGLLERGVYYADLEKAISDDEPTMAVFVDMGFLKYFDKQGGKDVGNDALRLAASLMERAIEQAGVDGEAYRYGGDEFTLLVKGGPAEAKKVLRALELLNEEAGAVPSGKKSREDYVPTELQFSHGIAGFSDMKQLAERSGKNLSVNEKAELMTHIADVGVEYLKAADRFDYLLEQMGRPEFHDRKFGTPGSENVFTRQLESKIAYSSKALFSELGGETVLRIFADEIRNFEKLPDEEREGMRAEIDRQIRKFILDRVDASRNRESETKAVLDRFIEMRTRMGYLEEELGTVRAIEREGSDRIKLLEAEVARTTQDMEDLTAARERIHA